ncbi:MAG: alpha/beta hydrolase [Xenococcaceae cyanobacterium MO_188.B29]|nr:alpha/beta hydrolase [Xenococcaceae cyanobacterium MO_188.B29]
MLGQKISKLVSLSQILVLSTGVTLALSNNANATEFIELQYQDRYAAVTINELSRFARNGVIPQSIQNLFDSTNKIPSDISSILNKELKISAKFVNSFINSSIGDFVLGGLDEVINNSSSRGDLTNVRSTLVAAYEDDNRVSLIELIERYPQRELKVNVTDLEGTYNKISDIVEDVLPALEVAKSYVQDLVCECNPIALSEEGTTTLVASNNANCNKTNAITREPAKSQAEKVSEILARNNATLSQAN